MNPVILYFADGTLFFVGLLGALVGAAALLLTAPGLLQSGLFVAACVFAGLAVLSSTPFPVWVYGVWLAGYVTLLVLARWDGPRGRWPAVWALAVMVAFSAALGIYEHAMRRMPRLPMNDDRTIFVIGDSLSEGMTTGETVWPTLLADRLGRPVRNLARAGARTREAMEQAWLIPEGPAIVLVEIGGNDLLGGGTAARFEDDLEALLAAVSRPDRVVAMMELPLPPLRHGFGRVQRRLARRHGVLLIPKRVLADVFRQVDSTVDGLHLSLSGHETLAHWMAQIFLKPDEPGADEQ